MRLAALFLLLILLQSQLSAQISRVNIDEAVVMFAPSPDQKYGFDQLAPGQWSDEYEVWTQAPQPDYRIAKKSVLTGQSDEVGFVVEHSLGLNLDSIQFRTSFGLRLNWYRSALGFRLNLVPRNEDYQITAFYGKRELGKLNVIVLQPRQYRLVIVPLIHTELNLDSVEAKLNQIYAQAGIRFTLVRMAQFRHRDIDTLEKMENPSMDYERYTDQMHHIRNLWLDAHPGFPKERFVYFITPGFTDPYVRGFTVKGKVVGFVMAQAEKQFTTVLARNLARSIGGLSDSWNDNGPEKFSTRNLMDRGSGALLRASQWSALQSTEVTWSVFDNYENVRTNNGMVAFYFWKQNADGTIQIQDNNLLKSIRRPFKKNYFTYHLNITNPLFRGLFTMAGYRFSTLHLFLILTVSYLGWVTRRRIRNFFEVRIRTTRILRFTGFLIHLSVGVAALIGLLRLFDQSYYFFEVRSGQVETYQRLSMTAAMDKTGLNENPKHPYQLVPASQVLLKKGQRWFTRRADKVLHFSVIDNAGKYGDLRFLHSRDSLVVEDQDFRAAVSSHYFVIHVYSIRKKLVRTRVFNHFGAEITDILRLPDPVRRVLIFVNGYRPTSIGATFEDKFRDIRNRGLEFPDSRNIVYDFDRFDYWNPWNEMDEKFRKRVNPANVYYADGHFGVRTSNYRSLLNFTTVSTIYPHRCADQKHHTCYANSSIRPSLLAGEKVRTIELLRARSNRGGFIERRRNGRIAGRNILQMLNDIPNRSENDTLFLVAHSMGYAYALGIADELRGKIHFGSFYIVAPENAKAGKVDQGEWKEVWQYGSKLSAKKYDPPCLQDGVAPQSAVAGISPKQRVYFPLRFAAKRGFFDTHFIGYYDWIFDIPKGKAGYVQQR